MEPVIVVLIIFGSVGLILWKFMDTRHTERMAMIEKGVSPADFRGTSLREMIRANPLSNLKWGLIALFVGIGLTVANMLDRNFYLSDSIYPSSMLIAGGIALIIFYFIASKQMKEE